MNLSQAQITEIKNILKEISNCTNYYNTEEDIRNYIKDLCIILQIPDEEINE